MNITILYCYIFISFIIICISTSVQAMPDCQYVIFSQAKASSTPLAQAICHQLHSSNKNISCHHEPIFALNSLGRMDLADTFPFDARGGGTFLQGNGQ